MLGIFLDTETSGLDPSYHRAIEIAYKIIDVSNGNVLSTFDAVIQQSEEDWEKRDLDSLKINGFTWEEVQKGLPIAAVSTHIQEEFLQLGIQRKKAVFICQNPSFDRSFFSQLVPIATQEKKLWPYHWLDLASMFWALTLKKSDGIYPWIVGCSKDNIASFLGIPPEKSPHRAMNGVNHLLECYTALVGFPGEA